MYDSIEDEESDALLPDAKNENTKSTTASKSSVMINRLLVIIVLAGLVAVSIWLQSFQTQLTEQLSTDEDKIKELQETVTQLVTQVQELRVAASRRCKICGADFIPLKTDHKKCKPCTIAKSTISCKKCKQFFAQKQHHHKYCDACFK